VTGCDLAIRSLYAVIVGQDCILARFATALPGFLLQPSKRVKNPLQITNLPHRLFIPQRY
jgi:hypothetical protein